MEKEACLTCKSLDYYSTRIWSEAGERRMTCDRCSQKSFGWRDGEGNIIAYKDIPGVWHTLGRPINSARELSEHAKKHNLGQKGVPSGKPC